MKSKIVNKCQICNLNKCNEIHHIKFQQDADQNGFINHIHKNNMGTVLLDISNE